TTAALRKVVASGQPAYGMAAVGRDQTSAGAELIVHAALKDDPRPLWVLAWGGANTLAQALVHAQATRTPRELEQIVAKLRVYSISDQDDAGPWIRREFPALHYVAAPSTPDGEQYSFATWTGISGDRFYKNAPGADFTTFSDEWVNENVRRKGPLGKHYPFPCCIHEGDTPSFLGLIDNGLASAMSPAYGGWGGRYVWRQPYGETRPLWTQGGDSYPGRDNSRDTVSVDGKAYTSDQATIWRWRRAFQHDFAARMDWTIKDVAAANHNPQVVVNGRADNAPLVLDVAVGAPVTLDAAGTRDPDGHGLTLHWFFYPEAGSGIPEQPVFAPRPRPASPPEGGPGEGSIPSAPAGGPREAPARVVVENASGWQAVVTPKVAGVAHVILAVEDQGTPSLTSYRRIILNIAAR
ncbi:MAG TPA: nucleoside hydrolase-like domain-containing protein, partial [Vicinamibacteria bacterium]